MKLTNAACGSKITASYDMNDEKDAKNTCDSGGCHDGWGYGSCDSAALGILRLCEDVEDERAHVAEKIKHLQCRHEIGLTERMMKAVKEKKLKLTDCVSAEAPDMSYKDGTLTVIFDYRSQPNRCVRSFVQTKL